MQNEIEYVIVLMLENRSFDNVLAWLYSQNDVPHQFIPADGDTPFLGLSEDTLSQYTNVLKDSNGNTVFTCQPIKGIPSVAQTNYLNSPQYDPYEPFQHVMKQIFGDGDKSNPTMSGFLQDYASLWWDYEWESQRKNISAVMETYTDKELPILYSLAKHYAVSDLWFSSVPTQTNPNRAFSICGTSEGEVDNGFLGKSTFQSDTIWNRLVQESPETTWMIFWQSDMLPGIFPGSFCKNNFPSLNKISNLDSHIKKIDAFHEMARNGQLPNFSFIEPQWTISINLDPKVKLFSSVVKNNGLLFGLQGNDLHPPGDVRTAENLLANIYTSLISNEDAWSKTLLIVTFDEHGGIYDHIAPPKAIPPDDFCQKGFNFDRYGVRVPALFISPKIKKSTVIRSDNPNIPFDHTSIIATILKWKNIPPEKWNMGKRVAQAPTFDRVVTCCESRKDATINPFNFPLSQRDENVLQMGDKFYLQYNDGCFLSKFAPISKKFACLKPNKEDGFRFEFTGGAGKITHGSFVLIKSDDPLKDDANMLENLLSLHDCVYEKNSHSIGQWWTVKSVEHPYLGAEIHYGDKIYLESHVYLDLFQYVPGRLAHQSDLIENLIITRPVSEEESDTFYWTLVRPD